MADSGAKAMGSLYDLLLDFVDTARVHDSNYEIAHRLLEDYGQLSGLSLRQMSELCYTSQASFSRFCRFLGFESFAEFKEAIAGVNYRLADDYTREFQLMLGRDEHQAICTYRTSLLSLLSETLDDESFEAVPELLAEIEAASRVAFFSHHFLWHIGRYFQGKLLQLGRYVELYQSFEHQWEAAQSLGEGDLAIICSVNGSYLSHYQDIVCSIFSSGAKVALITQNRHAMYLSRADHVLYCGTTNENDMGKYAALMTIDYLVMSYRQRLLDKEGHHE